MSLEEQLVRRLSVLERKIDRLTMPEMLEESALEFIPSTPLYDSGWVISASSTTFTHSLNALPLLFEILAADDSGGTNPSVMMRTYVEGSTYGAYISSVTTTQLVAELRSSGYAYSSAGSKWYVPATDYIRLVIWATE